ncbi:hypothetical protein Plhal304r1_c002g0005421 [Plasmopara halstedii]
MRLASLSTAERGRRPNDKEVLGLLKIQCAYFNAPQHLQSDLWKEAGLSASNPAIDLILTKEHDFVVLSFLLKRTQLSRQ